MKKIFITLLIIITSFVAFSQTNNATYYTVYQTELYIYNNRTNQWDLETQNKNTDIEMVFYINSINIQAKTPTLYKLKTESKQTFRLDNGLYGVSFDALDCVNDVLCRVDYVYSTSNKSFFLISVTFENNDLGKVNLRYYSTLKN